MEGRMMPDRFADKVPVELTGWFVAFIFAIGFLIKYGATWLRAFKETKNSETATLLTGLKMRLDDLNAEVDRKETTIQRLAQQQKECKEDTRRMEKEIKELKVKIEELEVIKRRQDRREKS
jgi:peptidoglycan hydrolase CwlO-like protein